MWGIPVSVGTYAQGASPYGVLDMAGNVRESVNDLYDSRYYGHIRYYNSRWTNIHRQGRASGARRFVER